MTEPADQFAAAQAVEYGTFRATQVILYDGVRAYNVGDPVPASNVEAHGYEADGLVERVTPAAAPASPSAPQSSAAAPTPTAQPVNTETKV